MEKVKVKGLPESSNEFWEGEVELTNIAVRSTCEHIFERVGARDIKCKKCGVGMFLDSDDIFIDGHLTRDGKVIF
jgi:hypothetical protein